MDKRLDCFTIAIFNEVCFLNTHISIRFYFSSLYTKFGTTINRNSNACPKLNRVTLRPKLTQMLRNQCARLNLDAVVLGASSDLDDKFRSKSRAALLLRKKQLFDPASYSSSVIRWQTSSNYNEGFRQSADFIFVCLKSSALNHFILNSRSNQSSNFDVKKSIFLCCVTYVMKLMKQEQYTKYGPEQLNVLRN